MPKHPQGKRYADPPMAPDLRLPGVPTQCRFCLSNLHRSHQGPGETKWVTCLARNKEAQGQILFSGGSIHENWSKQKENYIASSLKKIPLQLFKSSEQFLFVDF